jgi:methionyl-tRNA formyltransferase
MKIVFFGTPDYVLPILDSLHKTFRNKTGESPISAVVTQKPRPTGRKQILTYSPVDTWARKKKVPVFYDSYDLIKNKVQAELGIIASFGQIIPKNVISHFPYGILNIHFSLLPKLRGAAPVEATIVMGEREAGVSIFAIDEFLDHGPIISQFTEEIRDDDTSKSLRLRLFKRTKEVLLTLLPAYLKGQITPREQDHKSATFTTLVKKADGFIPPKYLARAIEQGSELRKVRNLPKWKIPFIKDYSLKPDPYNLDRFIRAMQPWPQAWTYVHLGKRHEVKGKRLKILKAHVEDEKFVPDEVQLEGKSPVSWKQFRQGYNVLF